MNYHQCPPSQPTVQCEPTALYYACDGHDREVTDPDVGPAYLCRLLDGVVTHVRRSKFVDARDAQNWAHALNHVQCED